MFHNDNGNKKGQAKVEIAAPKFSEKNRCSGYNNFNEYHLFFSEYSGAGLRSYWIRNDNFNFSLSLSVVSTRLAGTLIIVLV